MNIQRHRRSNVNTFPRNIKMFEDDLRIDQQDVLKGLHDFSPRAVLRAATTDEGKLSESTEAMLTGILFDAE